MLEIMAYFMLAGKINISLKQEKDKKKPGCEGRVVKGMGRPVAVPLLLPFNRGL